MILWCRIIFICDDNSRKPARGGSTIAMILDFVVLRITGCRMSSALPTKNSQLVMPFLTAFSFASFMASGIISIPNTSPQCCNNEYHRTLGFLTVISNNRFYLWKAKPDGTSAATYIQQRCIWREFGKIDRRFVENLCSQSVNLKKRLWRNPKLHSE